MRTTVTLDDALLARAAELAPGLSRAELFKEAFQTFIHIEASKQLAALGGKAPKMADIPRRKPATRK